MFSDQLSHQTIVSALSTALMGRRVDYLPTTASTMDDARKAALDNAPEGALVVADEQTAGRGRFQRVWVSPAGANLLFSLVLRPEPEASSQLSMMASLALANVLRRLVPDASQVTIKWPNDVRVGGKKIGGILIESSLAQEGADGFSIVGMGINVNFDPGEYPEIRDIATSLRQELGHPLPRAELLADIMGSWSGCTLASGGEAPYGMSGQGCWTPWAVIYGWLPGTRCTKGMPKGWTMTEACSCARRTAPYRPWRPAK